ncbi:MAG: hypothetical protein ACE5IZ_06345, partial [Dehalococcoidia bacterium]
MVLLDFVRVAFALGVVSIAPGWLALRLWRRRAPGLSLGDLPLAFSLSVAAVSFLALAGWALSLPLTLLLGLALAAAAATVGLLAWDARRRVEWRRLGNLRSALASLSPPTLGVLTLALAAVGLAAWEGIWFGTAGDRFYHLAAIRSLVAEDALLVEEVIYADAPSGLDPTSGSWHTALAAVVRLSGLDVVDVWPLLPLLIAPLVVVAFYSFALVLLESRGQALGATVLQFAVFWALDFRDVAFPNHMGWVLLWTALALSLLYMRRGHRRYGLAAAAIAVALALVHLILAEFFFIALGAFLLGLLLFARRADSRRELARGAQVLVVALLLAVPIAALQTDVGDVLAGGTSGPSRTDPRPSNPWPGAVFSDRDPIGFFPGRFTAGTLAYLATVLLLPAALRGERRALFLVANMAVVPVIVLNDPLLDFLRPRLGLLALLRLPFILPGPLVLAVALNGARGWLERWRPRGLVVSRAERRRQQRD